VEKRKNREERKHKKKRETHKLKRETKRSRRKKKGETIANHHMLSLPPPPVNAAVSHCRSASYFSSSSSSSSWLFSPSLFCKWRVKSKLIHSHSPLFTWIVESFLHCFLGRTAQAQTKIVGSDLSQYIKKVKECLLVGIGLTLFWVKVGPIPFESNSAQARWAQPPWLGLAQPNVFYYNIIIYYIIY
jgi:hypothetical protein